VPVDLHPCSAPRPATPWMTCSRARVPLAGPGPPTPASSRRLPRWPTRRPRPGPTRHPRPRAALLTRRLRPHTTPLPSCCWNLPGDRPHSAGDGPVPWPGSLPGPWFLARVLPEAQCQGVAKGHFRRKREAPLILSGSTSQFRGHPRT
jgi:hypothetical protein